MLRGVRFKNVVIGGLFLFCVVLSIGGSFSFAREDQYSDFMRRLDDAHTKVLDAVSAQEKKVAREWNTFKTALEQEYTYMSLHCLGVMNLQYSGDTHSKDQLLQKLVAMNGKIYSYHLGLRDNPKELQTMLSGFVDKEIASTSKNIYRHYLDYKADFLRDLQGYVKKNQKMLVPLIYKMKFITDIQKKFADMKTLAQQKYAKFSNDDFLKKITAIGPKLRQLLAYRFDMMIQKKGLSKDDTKVLQSKEAYLVSFDKDFRALFANALSIPLYTMDSSSLDSFLSRYYPEKQYQCAQLVQDEGIFSREKNQLYSVLAQEQKRLDTFSHAIDGYTVLSKQQQDMKKIILVKQLKALLDRYTGQKLRSAIVGL